MKSFVALSLLGALVAPALAAIIPRQQGKLPPVTVKGNAFWTGDTRFYVRGVAYQPGMHHWASLGNQQS
jgi:1,3-beta-glucanosyltransferase GAS5